MCFFSFFVQKKKRKGKLTMQVCPAPDVFEYSIPDYPLHLKPWSSQVKVPNAPPENGNAEEERKQQRRTREFFRFIRNAMSRDPTIQHDTIMSNGESVGAASLWHIHQYHTRKTNKQ